jgi:hypothetical protein
MGSSGKTSKPTVKTAIQDAINIRSAVAWRPTEGDMVSGTLVKTLKRDGGEFGPYPVMVLNTGELPFAAVHVFHKLLLEQLKELKPQPGIDITIVYQGRQESKNLGPDGKPRTYHNYILIADGIEAEVEYNWDIDESDRIPE